MVRVTVSIPDDLYDEAEKLATGLRVSRSALYARALARLVHDADGKQITAALDTVYGKQRRGDRLLDRAAANVLEDEGW